MVISALVSLTVIPALLVAIKPRFIYQGQPHRSRYFSFRLKTPSHLSSGGCSR
jgi:hypothetical protein